ncbi:MAG: MogA/MoaB family molybdenum cofactor biosynthesis protein [Actinomycetota bacterium]|nr:MogA/MoaB family molybdenum cofactor biosynthesis protein [Actinomycetota bacterium]
MTYRAAVITISDRVSRGEQEDVSGAEAEAMLSAGGFEVSRRTVVPDDHDAITTALLDQIRANIDLVVTTGGTGLAPRDVTPEATRSVVTKEVPGLSQLMLLAGLVKTPHASLSRAVVGVRDRTLIVNLPGNTGAVRDGLEVAIPVLSHALDTMTGRAEHAGSDHPPDPGN